jgi:hypothetical protein
MHIPACVEEMLVMLLLQKLPLTFRSVENAAGTLLKRGAVQAPCWTSFGLDFESSKGNLGPTDFLYHLFHRSHTN